MNSMTLQQEWALLAPAWIEQAREGRNPTRKGLLDRPMLEACGKVEGLQVLDCGCGEGRFCRMLAERGANYVLGLDLCEAMVEAARERRGRGEAYRRADVQDLEFIEEGTFDLAVSYLNQCDVPDVQANNREVFRVLRPGGRYIVANLHPMRSAVGAWVRNREGGKEHVILDRYFEEGIRRWNILGVTITNFHRSLSTYLDGFFEAGFALERILEPSVTPEDLRQYPEMDDELRVPNFIIYQLRKT